MWPNVDVFLNQLICGIGVARACHTELLSVMAVVGIGALVILRHDPR